MTCNVFCPNCGTHQDENDAHFGVGPERIRFNFTCPGCGWLVETKAETVGFMVRQMAHIPNAQASPADRSEDSDG